MKILILEPNRYPREADIPHTLEAMQETVGGYIQALYPWEERAALVCDDEGQLKRKPFNRVIGNAGVIVGTCFICGIDEEDFSDLPADLMERFMQKFHFPQMLIRTPHGIRAVPMPAEGDAL